MINQIICGIDCSTSTIGIGILSYDGYNTKLIHQEYFKPPKAKGNNIFQRLAAIKKYITKIYQTYNPDFVAIEDFLLFMKNKSGAKTIVPLAIFNRTIGLTIFELSGKEPEMCNVNSIRAKLKIGKKRPKKEDMPALLEKHLNITFPWYYKVNRKTKKQEIMEESLDVADGVSVALYYIFTKLKKSK